MLPRGGIVAKNAARSLSVAQHKTRTLFEDDSDVSDVERVVSDDDEDVEIPVANAPHFLESNFKMMLAVMSTDNPQSAEWAMKLCNVAENIANRPEVQFIVNQELKKEFSEAIISHMQETRRITSTAASATAANITNSATSSSTTNANKSKPTEMKFLSFPSKPSAGLLKKLMKEPPSMSTIFLGYPTGVMLNTLMWMPELKELKELCRTPIAESEKPQPTPNNPVMKHITPILRWLRLKVKQMWPNRLKTRPSAWGYKDYHTAAFTLAFVAIVLKSVCGWNHAITAYVLSDLL